MQILSGLLTLCILLLVTGGAYVAIAYNRMQQLAQTVREAQSNVQVAVSRKLSLVNQLVDIVRTFQESEQFTHIRISQDTSASALAAAYQQSGAVMNSIVAVADRFPELKASEQYHRLIDSVQQCEQEIQVRRTQCNACIREYNVYLLSIPNVFFAKAIGFSSASFLEFDGTTGNDAVTLKEFRSDDGERLRELLASGAEQLGKAGRSMATQAAAAGRVVADRLAAEPGTFVPPGSTSPAVEPPCYYLDESGAPAGPVPHALLRTMLVDGRLSGESLVAPVGSTEWVAARTILAPPVPR